MGAEDKTPGDFASLYFSGRRAKASKRPQQADLFGLAEAPRETSPATPPFLAQASALPSSATPLPATPVVPKPTLSSSDLLTAPAPPSVPERKVWTVRALVNAVRAQLERQYLSIYVEGEISNCRPAASGHLYFTLKDGEAQLPVVMFRREAQLSGVRPKDGDAVEIRGRISIYESRGQLQLIAETMELRGAGALEAAFKRLKAKLKTEGLFEESRKRPLPAFPHCIGIVTSQHGAVIEDIVHVVRRRHARLNLLIYPATMQGTRCASDVSAGIRWFNLHPERVDLIILARGGGSIEDLAGFNDEGLARVIAGSTLPIVSAIGHETDFTIADFVADLRAPTPSAAAEMVTAAQHRIEDRVLDLARRVQRAMQFQLLQTRQRYARLSAEAVLRRLQDAVNRRDQQVDDLTMQLETVSSRSMRTRAERLRNLQERLRHHEPRLRLAAAQRRFERATEALAHIRIVMISRRLDVVDRVTARLQSLSPVAVLSRGYALVYTEEGTLVRHAEEVLPGQQIQARLGTGRITARVEESTR